MAATYLSRRAIDMHAKAFSSVLIGTDWSHQQKFKFIKKLLYLKKISAKLCMIKHHKIHCQFPICSVNSTDLNLGNTFKSI